MTFFGSSSHSIFLFEHDLFRKTGIHFSGSCSSFTQAVAGGGVSEAAPALHVRGRECRTHPLPRGCRSGPAVDARYAALSKLFSLADFERTGRLKIQAIVAARPFRSMSAKERGSNLRWSPSTVGHCRVCARTVVVGR